MTRRTLARSVVNRVACCLLILCCADVPRLTASASDSLSALNQRGLKTVYVERLDGQETTGRFVSSTDTELVLLVDGTQRVVPVHDIRQVSVMKRATGKGLLIGYLIGAFIGGLSTQGAPCAECGKGQALAMAALGTGIGTLAGYKQQHKQVVYSAPASSVSALPLTR